MAAVLDGSLTPSPFMAVQAINLRTQLSSDSDKDDDDDFNVDPNMASSENQYMFGAAVNQAENNQADKEDKGADAEDGN